VQGAQSFIAAHKDKLNAEPEEEKELAPMTDEERKEAQRAAEEAARIKAEAEKVRYKRSKKLLKKLASE
jgi:hypothetical protein